MKLSLEEFIMAMDAVEVGIEDALYSFWADTRELEERVFELTVLIKDNQSSRRKLPRKAERTRQLVGECALLFAERKKIRAKLGGRGQRVHIAFNQLFLAGRVRNNKGVTFSEMKEQAIQMCKKHIEQTKQEVAEGKGGVMTECWLGNLEDYLKSYQQTEVLKVADLSPLLKGAYKPKGKLICVGSELTTWTWPSRIYKLDKIGSLV